MHHLFCWYVNSKIDINFKVIFRCVLIRTFNLCCFSIASIKLGGLAETYIVLVYFSFHEFGISTTLFISSAYFYHLCIFKFVNVGCNYQFIFAVSSHNVWSHFRCQSYIAWLKSGRQLRMFYLRLWIDYLPWKIYMNKVKTVLI